MKLWDSLSTCLIVLLGVLYVSALPQPTSAERRARAAGESPLELPPVRSRLSDTEADTTDREETQAGDTMQETSLNQLEDVVDFIEATIGRIRRSSSSPSTTLPSSTSKPRSGEGLSGRNRNRRARKNKSSSKSRGGRGGSAAGRQTGRKVRGGGAGARGRAQGCVLKQIHLNVTDLSLGYRSGEEMIFRYCSGPCGKSETNYDKILYNLVHARRLPPRDKPPQACCRPTAFDDDLSFLDDNLVYHTVRKHSARRCGCV